MITMHVAIIQPEKSGFIHPPEEVYLKRLGLARVFLFNFAQEDWCYSKLISTLHKVNETDVANQARARSALA